MNISNMKNIIVLKNLPSNLVEEAIVVLKENKKAKRYQYAERKNEENVEKGKKKTGKTANNQKENDSKEYILKEAEMVVSNYISNLETKSPKWKNNMKKLENRYKQSIKLNIILGIATFISLILSFI